MPVRRIALALAVVAIGSCSDAIGPNDEIAGLYALQRVNAQALPTSLTCGGFTLVASELALSVDGHATFTRRLITLGAAPESVYFVVTGRYRLTDSAVLVEGDARWSNSPSTYREQARFERVGSMLRGGGDGPACDAPPSVEEYERVVGL